MKEAIVHTTTGGFAAIATAFVAESLQNMIPWLIVSCAVILCDLLFGVRKSILMGEKVRFSRAIRATMVKMVTYFAFVCMVCMISVASHNDYRCVFLLIGMLHRGMLDSWEYTEAKGD